MDILLTSFKYLAYISSAILLLQRFDWAYKYLQNRRSLKRLRNVEKLAEWFSQNDIYTNRLVTQSLLVKNEQYPIEFSVIEHAMKRINPLHVLADYSLCRSIVEFSFEEDRFVLNESEKSTEKLKKRQKWKWNLIFANLLTFLLILAVCFISVINVFVSTIQTGFPANITQFATLGLSLFLLLTFWFLLSTGLDEHDKLKAAIRLLEQQEQETVLRSNNKYDLRLMKYAKLEKN